MNTPTTPGSSTSIRSAARVRTATPARYAEQLVSHLGRKITFVEDAAISTWTTSVGETTGSITVGDGELVLSVTRPDADATARVEHALGGHLERFGTRQELTVTWQRDV